jgi:hypothetical protein
MEVMRKLTVCINNTKKTVSLPQVTQMMRMFRSFVFDTRKKEFASIVADVIDSFIEARSRFGYAPYELEFGVEKIQPLDPLYNPYHEPIIKTEPKPKEPGMPTTNSIPTGSNVHINSEGKKMYTINTDLWDDKIRNTLMAHFGDFGNTENMTPEEQAIHASIAEKLKPVFENNKPLKINDLSAKTPETTGNKPAKLTSSLQASTTPNTQPTAPHNQHPTTTAPFATNASLPQNEMPLITNDLDTKTHENNLSVAIALSEGYGKKPFSSHSSVAKATENLETMLEGLRKAFLQYHPLCPDDVLDPNATSNTATLPENETPLIINDLDTKTPENTGNKPATQQAPKQPNDNLIRQGEVFSRPVYNTPTWPFREEPRGNKYKY